MEKLLLKLCLLFSLSSVTAQEVPLYERITSHVPEIGVITEVYLGDRMLEQRTGEYTECIVPKRSFEKRVGGYEWVAKANEPLCKKNADSNIYLASYSMVLNYQPVSEYFARLVDNNDHYELHLKAHAGGSFSRALRFKNINKDDIEINDRWFIYEKDSFQQTIEYTGNIDDNLNFIYSEFNHGFARDAFTREFQIDYAKGDVAAYKGAIIKIHDATNVNIAYEVIRNFQQ